MNQEARNKIASELEEALVNEVQSLDDVSLARAEAMPDAQSEPQLRFYESKMPVLKAGHYQLKAFQDLERPGNEPTETTSYFKQEFLISGPRFQIQKKDIRSVYPPAGVTGDFSLNLPQVSFERPSLPWELQPKGNNVGPWLCLVLFKQDEAPKPRKVKVAELAATDEIVGDANAEVPLIQVPKELMPEHTALLAHTRIGSGSQDSEHAYVVGHRMPVEQGDYEAHLISLRDFKDDEYLSLYSWDFICQPKEVSFNELMLKNTTGAFRLRPEGKDNELYQQGFVPLPYFMRKGDTTLAFYQSPLLPTTSPAANEDRLTELNPTERDWISLPEYRVLNETRKSAFLLGQMLTLSNREIAGHIFAWKRQFYQRAKSSMLEGQELFELDTQPFVKADTVAKKLPEPAKRWLRSLFLLETVPFNYLFPYEGMLPPGSIRFFRLNQQWIRHLVEGALSTADELMNFQGIHKLVPTKTTGFVLRNDVVAHYPELQIKAFADGKAVEKQLMFQYKLGEDILLCCFEGLIDEFELGLPGQSLYPGFSKDGNKVYKKLRRENPPNDSDVILNDSLLDKGTHCLEIEELRIALGAEDSAELAAEMLQAMSTIRYRVPY